MAPAKELTIAFENPKLIMKDNAALADAKPKSSLPMMGRIVLSTPTIEPTKKFVITRSIKFNAFSLIPICILLKTVSSLKRIKRSSNDYYFSHFADYITELTIKKVTRDTLKMLF